MEIFDAIRDRRAVRAFTDETVDQPHIHRLIEAAVLAPSAVNEQPWAFVVLRGRPLLAEIAEQARRYLLESIPDGSPMARFREQVADPGFDMFYGAPALILICATGDEPFATEDCALAAENLMLAARALHLGTCWIGLARPWFGQAECKKELGIELHYRPVAPIVVGRPSAWPAAPERRAPEIHWVGP